MLKGIAGDVQVGYYSITMTNTNEVARKSPNDDYPDDVAMDPVDVYARLRSPLAFDRIGVPTNLRVVGTGHNAKLVWGGKDRVLFHSTVPKKRMLEAFVSLADGNNDAILRFARRWGVLGLCACGLPHAHNPPRVPFPTLRWKTKQRRYAWGGAPTDDPVDPGTMRGFASVLTRVQREENGTPCTLLETAKGECWEPLDRWRELSAVVRATINVAQDLHAGRSGAIEDWKKLAAIEPEGSERRRQAGFVLRGRIGHYMLADKVNRMLQIGGPTPTFSWHRQGPKLGYGVARVMIGQLWGALCLQMVIVIARADAFLHCAACNTAYPADRQPKPGCDNFCPTCRRDGVPQLRAKQRHWKREKEGLRAAPLRQKSRKRT